MYSNIVTLVMITAGEVLFWFGVDGGRLFAILQPIGVNLSIMIAAVFVRLNRGMPTLDWKTLDPSDRLRLTASIVEVTKDYAGIVAVTAVTLLGLVTLTGFGQDDFGALSAVVQKAISAAFGGAFALCLASMAYVIWRDVDIVQLQQRVVDEAANREKVVAQIDRMEKTVSGIRGANLRQVATPKPKDWT